MPVPFEVAVLEGRSVGVKGGQCGGGRRGKDGREFLDVAARGKMAQELDRFLVAREVVEPKAVDEKENDFLGDIEAEGASIDGKMGAAGKAEETMDGIRN